MPSRLTRKATQTDQYLNFTSNHILEHKLSIVRTLHHRARTLISKEDRNSQMEHVETVLTNCEYPEWLLKRGAEQPKHIAYTPNPPKEKVRCQAQLPFIKGMSEQLCRTFKALGVGTYFKPQNTRQQFLVALKDLA